MGGTAGQLGEHRGAGDQLVALGRAVPPPVDPLTACHDGWGGALFVVEARNRGFNIHAWFGHIARYRT